MRPGVKVRVGVRVRVKVRVRVGLRNSASGRMVQDRVLSTSNKE